MHIFSLVILFWALAMKRIAFIFKNLKCRHFVYVLHSYKKTGWGFLYWGTNKAKHLSWHESVGLLCDVHLHENKFCATKSQAILILVVIHLSFIYWETEGFMPQLLIVCASFVSVGVITGPLLSGHDPTYCIFWSPNCQFVNIRSLMSQGWFLEKM